MTLPAHSVQPNTSYSPYPVPAVLLGHFTTSCTYSSLHPLAVCLSTTMESHLTSSVADSTHSTQCCFQHSNHDYLYGLSLTLHTNQLHSIFRHSAPNTTSIVRPIHMPNPCERFCNRLFLKVSMISCSSAQRSRSSFPSNNILII
jgi:hypothetical protein